MRPPCLGPAKPARSRSPRPWARGRLNGDGSGRSGRLELRPTGRRARRCPGLQPQVREDLLDERLLQDRNDLRLAAAVRAVLKVQLKAKLQRRLTCTQVMSQLNTRLSSRAQLSAPGCDEHSSPRTGQVARPGRVARALAAPPARAAWRWG